jgi:tetratricopeptide (TPR) repeat protein
MFLLGSAYKVLHQSADAMKYFKKCIEIERDSTVGSIFSSGYYYSIGFAYLQTGKKEKAEYYFNKQIEIYKRLIELNRSTYQEQSEKYLILAKVYSAMGEKEKAYKNLKIYNQKQVMSLYDVECLRHDPVLDSIRDEPQFRKILKDVELKYQAEHERVGKWLAKKGKL